MSTRYEPACIGPAGATVGSNPITLPDSEHVHHHFTKLGDTPYHDDDGSQSIMHKQACRKPGILGTVGIGD